MNTWIHKPNVWEISRDCKFCSLQRWIQYDNSSQKRYLFTIRHSHIQCSTCEVHLCLDKNPIVWKAGSLLDECVLYLNYCNYRFWFDGLFFLWVFVLNFFRFIFMYFCTLCQYCSDSVHKIAKIIILFWLCWTLKLQKLLIITTSCFSSSFCKLSKERELCPVILPVP